MFKEEISGSVNLVKKNSRMFSERLSGHYINRLIVCSKRRLCNQVLAVTIKAVFGELGYIRFNSAGYSIGMVNDPIMQGLLRRNTEREKHQ